MKRPCSIAIFCKGINGVEFDSPVENYSSEQPDDILFDAPIWPNIVDPRRVPCLGLRCLPKGCTANEQFSVNSLANWYIQTNQSQLYADLLAVAVAANCQMPAWPPGEFTFYNDAQTCTVVCDDFTTTFSFTVPYGVQSAGPTTMEAGLAALAQMNEWARSYACRMASALRTCMGVSDPDPNNPTPWGPRHGPTLKSHPGWMCLGETLYDSENTYEVRNPNGMAFTFAISAGAVPPGTTLVQTGPTTAVLRGKPSGGGTFTYTVTATSTSYPPITISTTDSLSVFGFSNCINPLPDAKCDQDYSYTFAVEGGVAPYTFRVAPGYYLPAGMTLDPNTGELSGATTEYPSTFHFVIIVEDSTTTPDGFPMPMVCGCETELNITGPKFLPPFPSDGTECLLYSFQMTTSPPANTCSFTGGAPDGLTVGPTGLISGVPVSPGVGTFSITATDSDGNTNTWVGTNTIFPDGTGVAKAIRDLNWAIIGTPTVPAGSSYSQNMTGGSGSVTYNNPGGTAWGGAFAIVIEASLARCALTASYAITAEISASFTTDATGPDAGKCYYTALLNTPDGIGIYSGVQFGSSWNGSYTEPPGILPPVGTASNNVQIQVQVVPQMPAQVWSASLTVNFTLTPLIPPP